MTMLRMWLAIITDLSLALLLASSTGYAKVDDPTKPFPNRSTQPLFSKDAIKVVAELPQRPGNIDVDPESGRVFFTFHPFGYQPNECKVCELKANFEGFQPFGDQNLFNSVLSIRVSPQKRLLMALDHKNFGEAKPVLYMFSLESGQLQKAFEFPEEIAGKGSFLNDFVISKDERFVFIADSGVGGQPSIVTLDVKNWQAKKALVAHESTKVRPTPKDFAINSTKYQFPFQVGVDSIALSADGNTVYFASLFDPYMWMVPARSLVYGKGDPESNVDIAFPKPVSDGIVVDDTTGLLYVTDFEHSAIWMTDPTVPGRHKTLVADLGLLRWPDGLSAARGYLWITASALHELFDDPPSSRVPYHILRIPLVKPQEEKEDL